MKTLLITLHFLTLEINTHSTRIYDWIKGYYTSFDQSERFPQQAQTYRIDVEEIDSAHALEIRAVDGAFAKFCLLNTHCYYKDGVFTSEQNTKSIHQIEVDTVARVVKINVGGEFAQSEESFIYNVMRDLLYKIILPTSGLINLHASVVARGATVICLSGDKGMGKSTIALKLMQSGYSIMSDDSPLFTADGGQTYALSSLDELSVTENTLRLFPELQKCITRQRDISGKYFVSRNLVTKLAVYGPLPLTHFIELHRSETDRIELKAKPKTFVTSELLREVMTLYPNFEHPRADYFAAANNSQFEIISQVVANAQCYSLSYSSKHLEQLPELLERNLAEVVCQ